MTFHRLVLASLLISEVTFAQVITTAVPFLLIGSSPEGNGMGNISSSVITSDPFAMIANPGQLGFQSLTEHFAGATYTNKTQWLPAFNLGDVNYSSDAVLVGTSVQDFVPFPLNLSVGFGYARTYFNLGQFIGAQPSIRCKSKHLPGTNNSTHTQPGLAWSTVFDSA